MNTSSQAAPSLPDWTVRLGIWLVIYIAAQVPLIWRSATYGENYSTFHPVLFPMALGQLVAIPLNLLPSTVADAIGGFVVSIGMISGYLAYGLNLTGVLRARTRRRLDLLFLMEVGMVLLGQIMVWQMTNGIRA